MRVTTGTARVTGAGPDFIVGRVRSFTDGATAGIVYCHGAGYTAMSTWQDPITNKLALDLGKIGTTVIADFGGDAFANDTAIALVGQAVDWLRARGVAKVALVGSSMGAANALAYTRANPAEVAALAGIVPLTDIADVRTRGFATQVDTAYGGAYNDTTHGPTHSPIRFATSLPEALPVRLWTASDDPVTVPATSTAFVAARPQTGRTNIGTTGHTTAAIAAASAGVAEFVRHHLG